MSNLETLRTWYRQIWIEQELDLIHKLFSPDIEALGLIDFAVGPDDFRVLAEAILAQVRILEVRFDRTVEMGDWVWVNFTGQAERLIDDAEFAVSGQVMARFKDGIIVEAYNQVDLLSLFENLDYFPKDTLALCLSGEGVMP